MRPFDGCDFPFVECPRRCVFHLLSDRRLPPPSAALSTGIPHPHAHNGAVSDSEVFGVFPAILCQERMLARATDQMASNGNLEKFVRKTIADLRHGDRLAIRADNQISTPDVFDGSVATRTFYLRSRWQAILVAQVRQHELHVHRRRRDAVAQRRQAIGPVQRLGLRVQIPHPWFTPVSHMSVRCRRNVGSGSTALML